MMSKIINKIQIRNLYAIVKQLTVEDIKKNM